MARVGMVLFSVFSSMFGCFTWTVVKKQAVTEEPEVT